MSEDKELRRPVASKKDMFLWWAVNLSAGFFLSGAHNVLFFASDIHTPVIHFMHHASTAVFLFLFSLAGIIPKHPPLPIKEFAIPVAAKVLETFLSSIVHSQNRTGGLYVLRIFDVITTVAIVYWGKQFGLSDKEKPANKHLLLLGLAASLSWLEFGQMEYTFFSFICSPLLALARAYSILSVWRLAQKLRPPSLDLLTMYYCGLTALALALPALISFSSRTVEVTASWESIDTVLMYLSPIFMASALYSELWLCLVAGPKTFQVAEHGKYFLASLGQWIIQNMAHPSILALIGKILFVGSAVRAVAHGFSE